MSLGNFPTCCCALWQIFVSGLMASTECLTRNGSPYPLVVNPGDQLLRYDSRNGFEPLLYDRTSTYDFDESLELATGGLDPDSLDPFSSSLYHLQTVDYGNYQEGRLYPFDDPTILGGSAGQYILDDSQIPASPSTIPQECDSVSSSTKGERTRSVGSQSIECPECQQTFDNLHLLEQHTIKEAHKAWKCLERNCGKAYPRRDTLSRHQLKHSAKGHECTTCQRDGKRKVFKRKDHLAEHIRKRHLSSQNCKNEPKKQDAMQDIVKSLVTVLGENHQVLRGLGSTVTGLSSSGVTSVAEKIAERIAQATADHSNGCGDTMDGCR